MWFTHFCSIFVPVEIATHETRKYSVRSTTIMIDQKKNLISRHFFVSASHDYSTINAWQMPSHAKPSRTEQAEQMNVFI